MCLPETALICTEIKSDGKSLSMSWHLARAALKCVFVLWRRGDVFVPALSSNVSEFFSKALTLLVKWNLSCPHLLCSLCAPGFSKWWRIFYLNVCVCVMAPTLTVSKHEWCRLRHYVFLSALLLAASLFFSLATGSTSSTHSLPQVKHYFWRINVDYHLKTV